jgi:hypothetical protein
MANNTNLKLNFILSNPCIFMLVNELRFLIAFVFGGGLIRIQARGHITHQSSNLRPDPPAFLYFLGNLIQNPGTKSPTTNSKKTKN